jgi:hypothetical protein
MGLLKDLVSDPDSGAIASQETCLGPSNLTTLVQTSSPQDLK